MAKTEERLTQEILDMLVQESQGLEVNEITRRLVAGDGLLSARGVRNLINKMEQEGKLIKRKRWGKKPGSPPYAYFHPDSVPHQLDFLSEVLGVSGGYQTRTEVERQTIEGDELHRLEEARSVINRLNQPKSVLHTIAEEHLESDSYAKAIINVAPKLAAENPVDLLVRMAGWMVENLNNLGEQATQAERRRDRERAAELLNELKLRLQWVRDYFQRLWRLHPAPPGGDRNEEILYLPAQAKHFLAREGHPGDRARFAEGKARTHLEKRVRGNKVIDTVTARSDVYKAVVGTDASVADLMLEHAQGSFIPPDPVVVTAAAAALKTREKLDDPQSPIDYQDFDIFPDQLKAYADLAAASQGLVISPTLRAYIPEQDIKHTRLAAMDLRQYSEDFLVATRAAKWRPFGGSPTDVIPRPRMIIRDGRIFPLVHRIGDYENNSLYGIIVRSEIEKFEKVFHNTVLGSDGIVYAAAVKDPEMSWLAPLVFWYLHYEKVESRNGKLVVEEEQVYRPPFADTAVSHLLFLGLAKKQPEIVKDRLFMTFRAIRRFSDIAVVGEAMIRNEAAETSLDEGPLHRLVRENDQEDWETYITQRIERKQMETYEGCLDREEYRSFIYLCSKAGVSMCYAAPMGSYMPLVLSEGQGSHFLIPRLEVAVDMIDPDLSQERRSLEGFLSWLAAGGWALDFSHTQTGFDTADREQGLPILVPDVVIAAHETVTFARDVLGQEVQDEIRKLIVELRRRMDKSR
jgi:hypothetical protein